MFYMIGEYYFYVWVLLGYNSIDSLVYVNWLKIFMKCLKIMLYKSILILMKFFVFVNICFILVELGNWIEFVFKVSKELVIFLGFSFIINVFKVFVFIMVGFLLIIFFLVMVFKIFLIIFKFVLREKL